MFFERIESPGLAQYSYLIGDGSEAVVIDPRRDCDIYIQKALAAGVQITYVLETHRHEDFAVGSMELARRTNAQIWHADPQLPYKYGKPVQAGQTWSVGRLQLQALHTPGHTEGSYSYVLYEPSGEPWMVFTGDVLMTGEVGRVDFLGMDRALEMASHLHESIFHKILPLGDGVLLCPAHGAGSACGSTIADRPLSTLGLERRLNPRLQHPGREAFMTSVTRQLPKPPYFSRMEDWNVNGPPVLGTLPVPQAMAPMTLIAFAEAASDVVILDLRGMMAFASGHIPGALSLTLSSLPNTVGWFVPYDVPLLLVGDACEPMPAVEALVRVGYDDVAGYLVGGMEAWTSARVPLERTSFIMPQELVDLLGTPYLLDVRDAEEVSQGRIPSAVNIPYKELPARYDEIPKDLDLVIYCEEGPRAVTAASLLQRAGCSQLKVLMGGIQAWQDDDLGLE